LLLSSSADDTKGRTFWCSWQFDTFLWALGEYGSVYSTSKYVKLPLFFYFFCILFWTVTKFIDLGKGKAQIINNIHTYKDLFVRDIDFFVSYL
jgi:hypothetical protein